MPDFLPKGYEAPVTVGNYMKFKQGDNQFRILSEAIVGYLYWNSEGKPVRVHEYPKTLPADIQMKDGQPSSIKHFWAFVVWNYSLGVVQILEITQKGIRDAIEFYYHNKKWGNPTGYDLTVNKTGEKLETEYKTIAEPHSKISKEIEEAYKAKHININALFEGKDPFALTDKQPMERADYPTDEVDPEDIPF